MGSKSHKEEEEAPSQITEEVTGAIPREIYGGIPQQGTRRIGVTPAVMLGRILREL